MTQSIQLEEWSRQVRRARGEGRIWKIGRIWWIQYYAHGQQIRESSHSDLKDMANRLLRQRLGEVGAGIAPPPRAASVTYEGIRDALLSDYAANQRKWLRHDKDGTPYVIGLSHLDRSFCRYRAISITTGRIRQHVAKRQKEGAANGTINRELALLRRMFTLSVADGRLRGVPYFPMLKETAPRKGFLDHVEFQKLRWELPEYIRPILTMGYYTGMRLGEILGLGWRNVSFLDAEIRLNPGSTKNDDPRTIPLAGELLEMLKIERQRNAAAEFVFARDGEHIGSFYKAWKSACKRAGLEGLLFHDLRRTGVRNLVRAGVPERVAMAISGHKTPTLFERYNIVSGRDLKDAASKLESYLAGQNGANSGQIKAQGQNVANSQLEKVH
jgi:integrase